MTSLLYYLSAHIRRIFDADTSPAPRPRLLFRDDRALRRFVRRGDGRPEELRARSPRGRVSGGAHDADGTCPAGARDRALAGGLELQAHLVLPAALLLRWPRRRAEALPMKNRLRVLRAERDWSQADLAARLEVSRQTINAIETGRYDPSLPLAFAIAKIFGKLIEEVFEADEKAGE